MKARGFLFKDAMVSEDAVEAFIKANMFIKALFATVSVEKHQDLIFIVAEMFLKANLWLRQVCATRSRTNLVLRLDNPIYPVDFLNISPEDFDAKTLDQVF